MRKVIYGINISVDGCYDHTRFTPKDEMYEYFINLLKGVDLIVYGRKTYELMVPYWPDQAKAQAGAPLELKYAETFSTIDRLVFSRTLQTVDNKTRIVSTDPVSELLKLKQQPGGNISIGGVNLPSQLISSGVIDEYHFIVHPVIVGDGKKLFDDIGLHENHNLKLVDTKVLEHGGVALHYQKL